jgi:GTPase SAR1 family protein
VQTLNDKVLNALGVDKVPRVLVGNKIDLENERYYAPHCLLHWIGLLIASDKCQHKMHKL